MGQPCLSKTLRLSHYSIKPFFYHGTVLSAEVDGIATANTSSRLHLWGNKIPLYSADEIWQTRHRSNRQVFASLVLHILCSQEHISPASLQHRTTLRVHRTPRNIYLKAARAPRIPSMEEKTSLRDPKITRAGCQPNLGTAIPCCGHCSRDPRSQLPEQTESSKHDKAEKYEVPPLLWEYLPLHSRTKHGFTPAYGRYTT